MSTSIKISSKTVYITPTGFKIGSKSKVMDPGEFYAQLTSKGERRKVRKLAYRNGFRVHAMAPTAA